MSAPVATRPKKPLPSVPSIELGQEVSAADPPTPPTVSPRAEVTQTRVSGHADLESSGDDDDDTASSPEEKQTASTASPRGLQQTASSPRGLNSSSDQIRPRGATGLSPRLGPLLGSARNSPLLKRKTKGSAKGARTSETSPSPPMSDKEKVADTPVLSSSPGTPTVNKALKVLGEDVGAVGASSEPHTGGLTVGRKVSPRPAGGAQTITKDFLRDLQSYKAASSAQLGRVSGSEGETHVVRKAMSNQVLTSSHQHSHAVVTAAAAVAPPASADAEYDANDTIEVLRERLDTQKQRYEKWKKEHLDDTRTKLFILTEENRKLQEQLAELTAQSEAWKTSYENVKQHAARAQTLWDEERAKLVKRYNEDQKRIERLQNKKKTKPQGLPNNVVKSSIFGRGKPPTTEPTPLASTPGAVGTPGNVSSMEKSMSVKGPAVGEPRLISHSATTAERDSTPLPVPGMSASAHNRIRKPEDFQLCSVVGQGGFGAVFLCKEIATNRVCAVKRMAKSTIIAKEQVHTVNVEVNVLKEARMEDNPWIVQFYYAFQDSRYIYLAMEFCSGGDLRNLIDNVELDEDGVRFLAAEMIVSVNSLHERGYVHRDLKPSNFLISPTGHLKLADFGLSKSGFSGVKKSTGDTAQAIRVFLVDDAYKTLVVNNDTTVNEVIKQLKIKLRVPKNAPWLIYECNTINGLQRERPMALDERPLKVASEWQKGLLYKFLFKEADQLRVQAMARTRVETSHKDPFFQREAKVTRRERMYSIVGSPHYMAAEILEGSGYDAVADWWSMGCILYEMLVGAPPFTGNSAEEVFAAVLNSKESLKFPQEGNQVSAEAKDLIYRFLSPPKERLGYNGVGSIKSHAWFAPINWPTLQTMTPPFEPNLEDELDCGYFESATSEGIEEMRMDDPKDVMPPDDDPWQKPDANWDWSDKP